MVGLLDIGPLYREITLRGKKMQVHGVSGSAFLALLDRFPEFRKVMSGGLVEPDPSVLLAQAPEAIGAIIAHVTGTPGDREAERVALQLTVGEQLEIINAAWEITFPQGMKNFLVALESLARQVAGDIGWDQATRSQEQLNS